MEFDYKKATPEGNFYKWVLQKQWRIEILIENGFTKDQAIEMLKVYALDSLEDIGHMIGSIG